MNRDLKKRYITAGILVLLFSGLAIWLSLTENDSSLPSSSGKQLMNLTNNPSIGRSAAEINLYDKNGKLFDLEALKGKKVVLFFSEGLGCYPACWNQISSFGLDERFNNDEVAAFSVIANSPADWEKAFKKMPSLAKSQVLFDPQGQTSKKLGLLAVKSVMHKGEMPGHTYMLLNKEGIVNALYDDPFMALNNDKIAESLNSL